MRDHKPASLDKWFESNDLRKLAERATSLNQIHKILGKILPDYFQDQYRIGNFSQGILIIEVTNAALANRLKFERLDILSQLRNNGLHQLSSLEIKINPALYQQQKKKTISTPKSPLKHKRVSPKTANLLRETAEWMPEEIKTRLKNIAKLIE